MKKVKLDQTTYLKNFCEATEGALEPLDMSEVKYKLSQVIQTR